MSNFAFPNLGEFNFVKEVLDGGVPLESTTPQRRDWLSVGDDCAEFDGWLVTKDMSAEGSHFTFEWSTPEEAVEKCIVSNVSDISAMGGVARLALLGICHNKCWSATTRSRVAKAFSEGFARRGIALIGGDTIAADTGLFSVTMLGTVESGSAAMASGAVENHCACESENNAAEKKAAKNDSSQTLLPLRRSSAKPGDNVYVVGTLGKSAAGLWLLMHHPELRTALPEYERLVKYHLCPQIAEDAGKELLELGVSGACMDISDGLSSEVNHLAISSRVRIEIDREKLPVDPDVLKLSRNFGLDPYEFALNGGEEYELLFTSALNESIFNSKFSYPVFKIGSVLEGENAYINNGNETEVLVAGAWTHL